MSKAGLWSVKTLPAPLSSYHGDSSATVINVIYIDLVSLQIAVQVEGFLLNLKAQSLFSVVSC